MASYQIPYNCDLDTTGGATACSSLSPGRNLIRVSVSLWFLTFAETFSLDARVPACEQRKRAREVCETRRDERVKRGEEWVFHKMPREYCASLICSSHTNLTVERGANRLTSWLTVWMDEWLAGWLTDWLTWTVTFHLSPRLSRPVPHSVCVCLSGCQAH